VTQQLAKMRVGTVFKSKSELCKVPGKWET